MTAVRFAMGCSMLAAIASAGSPAQAQTAVDPHYYVCLVTPETCADDAGGAGAARETERSGVSIFSAPDTISRPTTGISRRAEPARYGRQRPAKHEVAPGVSRNDLLITFANASATLTPQAEFNAKSFAAALRQAPGRRFAIEGHTNAIGTVENNRILSQARAQALIDFLVGEGVDAGRLEPRGYGFSRLLPGRAPRSPANRRVEVTPLP